MRKDSYRVVVNGDPEQVATRTAWGAGRWAKFARRNGLKAHVEKTNVCPTCDMHGCPGGQDCPDA